MSKAGSPVGPAFFKESIQKCSSFWYTLDAMSLAAVIFKSQLWRFSITGERQACHYYFISTFLICL
ncbi:hypothetical protein [Evansella vedderi]|uniref:hypothetical protein n=1 Tax=Evansella vedderi TaxID=38282 RepID=UPI0027D7FE33|nr:hypothetical protein [Evansella vedderi]